MPAAMAGACAAAITPKEILVMGGFSQATNDYIDLAFTFNTATHEWVTKHMAYKIQKPITKLDNTYCLGNLFQE